MTIKYYPAGSKAKISVDVSPESFLEPFLEEFNRGRDSFSDNFYRYMDDLWKPVYEDGSPVDYNNDYKLFTKDLIFFVKPDGSLEIKEITKAVPKKPISKKLKQDRVFRFDFMGDAEYRFHKFYPNEDEFMQKHLNMVLYCMKDTEDYLVYTGVTLPVAYLLGFHHNYRNVDEETYYPKQEEVAFLKQVSKEFNLGNIKSEYSTKLKWYTNAGINNYTSFEEAVRGVLEFKKDSITDTLSDSISTDKGKIHPKAFNFLREYITISILSDGSISLDYKLKGQPSDGSNAVSLGQVLTFPSYLEFDKGSLHRYELSSRLRELLDDVLSILDVAEKAMVHKDIIVPSNYSIRLEHDCIKNEVKLI